MNSINSSKNWLLWSIRWFTILIPLCSQNLLAADPRNDATIVAASKYGFDVLVSRVEKAVADQKMGMVAQASASRAAASRGVKIPGNAVLMVFRNDYAVRMLQASVPAGIEAPLRLYVTENADGTASLSYRKPSDVFALYGNRDLDEMAVELDMIFGNIVRDATGG